MIIDNPSIGNYEELGDLYLDDGQFVKARGCFDKVLAREDSIDPRYRRGLTAIAVNDFKAAVADLEQVVSRDPKYDYQRAAGLLAYGFGKIGERDKASTLFAEVTETSTLSETQYNYASFLAETGRGAEARDRPSGSSARRPRCPITSGAGSVRGFSQVPPQKSAAR
jgi:tetratricopeptide (TPR) repeat protein